MRILRNSKVSMNRSESECRVYNCRIYVRSNFAVAKANEWFYTYVGENSYRPFTDFISAMDAKILEEAMENLTEPVEIYTILSNLKDDSESRNVYVRMEISDRTENGRQLYLITVIDILDSEFKVDALNSRIAKYRYFLSLYNDYYFDYFTDKDLLIIYKYVNEKSIKFFEGTLDEFLLSRSIPGLTEDAIQKMETFCGYLRSNTNSFEMMIPIEVGENKEFYTIKGGVHYKNKNLVSGILVSSGDSGKTAYYLSPAGRDAGTGLLNKKAATEYALEKMHTYPDKKMWLLIMDIDDFKNINDSFGHLFGDEVIKKVADTILLNVGHRGIVGRFGGDEFFVLLDGVPTREALKTVLKTITKELLIAFDPKCRITTSIGVCEYPKDGVNFELLFGKADKALYIAKEKGKNRHIIYDEELHGAYNANDGNKTQSIAFVASREKRRESLINLVTQMHFNGVGYVTENPDVQRSIRDMFDLDGFTIYTDYGKKVLCRNGDYVCVPSDRFKLHEDEEYSACFKDTDIYAATGTPKLKLLGEKVYQDALHQEIGACVRCIARKDGVPFAMIDFDVFNRNRKWANTDVDLMGIIGCSIGKMLCQE